MPGQIGPGEIRRSLPDRFAAIDIPPSYELIGSRAISQYSSIVAFKTTASIAVAREDFKNQMETQEWGILEVGLTSSNGGIQRAQNQQNYAPLMLCNERFGQITGSFAESPSSGAYLTLEGTNQRSNTSCALLQPAYTQNPQLPKLPTLKLPSDAKSRQLGGSSSGRGDSTTSIFFETSVVTSELMTFFHLQLVAQDWIPDGSWAGRQTMGSGWLYDDGAQSGFLSIIDQGDSTFKLMFQAHKQPVLARERGVRSDTIKTAGH